MTPQFLLFAGTVNLLYQLTVQQCSNLKGDAYCASRLSTADYCVLDGAVTPCDCAKDCKAPTNCNDGNNTDADCTCMGYAKSCNSSLSNIQSTCPTTCQRRNTVICDPLGVNITGAFAKFNNLVPTYSAPKYGDVVTFGCEKGFNQTGGSTKALRRVCTLNGHWVLDPDHQSPLVCQRISCGTTPDVPKATPSQSTGVFGDTVNYTCVTGYYNAGPNNGSHFCNATGQWVQTRDNPDCQVVNCGPPPAVTHCDASVAAGVYGDEVTYTCKVGYNQTGGGRGRRQCQNSAVWNLASLNETDPICTVVSCGTPPVFLGTKASLTMGYSGDNVTFSCADDLVQVGGGTGRMTCDAAGVWEVDGRDTPPQCLGNVVNFVNSREEEQTAPPQALRSASARSNLECAAVCARAYSCYGYTFNRTSKVCAMNFVSYLPVITDMKKKYT